MSETFRPTVHPETGNPTEAREGKTLSEKIRAQLRELRGLPEKRQEEFMGEVRENSKELAIAMALITVLNILGTERHSQASPEQIKKIQKIVSGEEPLSSITEARPDSSPVSAEPETSQLTVKADLPRGREYAKNWEVRESVSPKDHFQDLGNQVTEAVSMEMQRLGIEGDPRESIDHVTFFVESSASFEGDKDLNRQLTEKQLANYLDDLNNNIETLGIDAEHISVQGNALGEQIRVERDGELKTYTQDEAIEEIRTQADLKNKRQVRRLINTYNGRLGEKAREGIPQETKDLLNAFLDQNRGLEVIAHITTKNLPLNPEATSNTTTTTPETTTFSPREEEMIKREISEVPGRSGMILVYGRVEPIYELVEPEVEPVGIESKIPVIPEDRTPQTPTEPPETPSETPSMKERHPVSPTSPESLESTPSPEKERTPQNTIPGSLKPNERQQVPKKPGRSEKQRVPQNMIPGSYEQVPYWPIEMEPEGGEQIITPQDLLPWEKDVLPPGQDIIYTPENSDTSEEDQAPKDMIPGSRDIQHPTTPQPGRRPHYENGAKRLDRTLNPNTAPKGYNTPRIPVRFRNSRGGTYSTHIG